MSNFKHFDPNSIDETLARVVIHRDHTYLMFPYINGTGAMPKMKSISLVIEGPAATLEDLLALSTLVKQSGEAAEWKIEFNTPWLLPRAEGSSRTRPIARA